MWAIVWSVGKWLWAVAKVVLLWAVANPLGTAAIGVALVVSGKWLEHQPWAGSDVLSAVVGAFGTAMVSAGLGAWVLGGLLPWIKKGVKVVRAVGAVAGWWWWIQKATKGGLPWP